MTATETRPAVDGRPRFEGAWGTQKLQEHCSASSGGTPDSKTRAFYAGDVPWASISDITEQGRFLASTERHLSRLGLARSAAQLWPSGTILYAMYASPGECSISKIEVSSSQAVLGIQCGATVDRDFLYYRLAASKRAITSSIQHGTQANLNKGMVMGLAFSFPSLPEQRAIAAALSDVDDLLQSLDRLIAKKRDVKQGAMQQLLTGATRLPGFEGEWETTRFGDRGDCVRGVGYDPERDLRAYDTEETWRLLRSTNVQGGRLVLDDLQFVDQSRVSTAQEMRNGDLLFCAANGSSALVGKSAAFTVNDSHRYTFGAFMGVFRPRAEAADSGFVGYVLQSRAFFGQVDLALSGSAINNLSPSAVESFQFSWPCLFEQRAIASILSDMDAEIDALEERRAKTTDIKQGMMQELLTGRTRLPIPQEA